LAILKLSFNDLHSIDPCLFQDLTSLNELGLVRNFLKEVHKDTFKGLINLNRLCLEYNQLEELDLNTFNELNNLLHLDLSFNKLKLKNIHRQLFENLVRLEWINLSNNCFKNEEKLNLILPPSIKFISFGIGFCGNNIELMQ
jgi:Leucine-rich repeat (LRR) protein